MGKFKTVFDPSNYPPNHPLFSEVNKEVLGKLKDKCPANLPKEYVGLKPKMCSLYLRVKE